MKLNDFHYGLSLLSTMYDMEIPEDDYEEIALIGWRLIGNRRTRLYRYSTCVNDCDEGVQLPCNLDEIESVNMGVEDFNYVTNTSPNGDLGSMSTEHYIEARKAFREPLYAPGKFIRYERVGDRLYFDRPYGKIHILYKGELSDDDGLPQITDKEALALATYVAYVQKYKEGLSTNNANLIAMSQDLKSRWDVLCEQARNDYYMSQNEWDEVLDAKTTWNRKQYNKSFKIYH